MCEVIANGSFLRTKAGNYEVASGNCLNLSGIKCRKAILKIAITIHEVLRNLFNQQKKHPAKTLASQHHDATGASK